MNDIYLFTVPVFQKSLTALDGILAKAQDFVKEKGADEAALLEVRLWPDMFPLKKQVQVACDNAKGVVARLSGTEIPVFADEEKTLAELRARISKTLDFVKGIPEDSFKDAATRKITMSYFPGKFMTGFDYAREYAVPNFLFHVVTAYDLLRKEGVQIGKSDYIGGMPLQDEA
ncbi:MAG: DUF1993 domain-containing protein [Patescibacteria group bacterium]